MNPDPTTQTPPTNEAVEGARNGPVPTGIDWINLMMISEHPQPDALHPAKSGPPPRWLLRIELDVPLKATDWAEVERLLKIPNFVGAGEYLLSVRSGLDATTQELIEVAFRNAASPKTPTASAEPPAQNEVVVQVIQDFGKKPKDRKAARAHFDVALPDAYDLDRLRDLITRDPEGARDELHNVIGGRDRPKHVVTAALADD